MKVEDSEKGRINRFRTKEILAFFSILENGAFKI